MVDLDELRKGEVGFSGAGGRSLQYIPHNPYDLPPIVIAVGDIVNLFAKFAQMAVF